MQDNFEKAWRDKLGGYQAPADPQDWAAMSAMLDAKEDKRAGFFRWGILALALLFTTGGIAYRYLSTNDGGTGTTIANNTPNGDNGNHTKNATPVVGNNENTSSHNTGGDNTDYNRTLANGNNTNNTAGNGTVVNSSSNDVTATTGGNGSDINNDATATSTKQQNKGGKRKNKATNTNSSANDNTGNGIGSGSTANTAAAGTNKSSGRKGNGGKNTPYNTTSNSNANQDNSSGNGNAGNAVGSNYGTKTSKGNSNGTATVDGTGGGTTTAGNASSPNTATYSEPVATLSLSQIKKLPQTTALPFAKDTGDIKLKFAKPSKVGHYIGFGTGINNSRVDPSGDYSTGFNVGLQYTMMVKNRLGLHAGLAYRLYTYYTNLVACNYDLYQCPNSYSSTIQTIDLHIGTQINLIKTNKVEWYVMGGVSNQFMLEETFEYDLPKVDTVIPGQPTPIDPPRNTSFTGAGVSSFEESLSTSDAFNPTLGTNADLTGEGKFLRERYLGAWYVGTGVTWNLAYRINLQVEPTIGRSLQFVGIQDKKLWNTGVNVRLNVKLGR